MNFPKISISTSQHPAENLAFEEYLFENANPLESYVFFYQNGPSVIIGRNQNPWLEANIPYLKSRGALLYRRITGGGAVYHDLGNLNFSIISPQSTFDAKANLNIIQRALESLGYHTTQDDHHNLLIDGKKISGSAFRAKQGKVLHHGTLLVSTSNKDIHNALTPTFTAKTSAVASRRSQTTSLETISKNDINTIQSALIKYINPSKKQIHKLNSIDFTESVSLKNNRLSFDWLVSKTPRFQTLLEHHFDFGSHLLDLEVTNGIITQLRSNNTELQHNDIQGKRFSPAELSKQIYSLGKNSYQFASWMNTISSPELLSFTA